MFTHAQVIAETRALDARIARVEALLVQLVAARGDVVAQAAAAPVVEAASALETTGPKVKVSCTLHADKRYALTPAGSPSGSGFHFGWCKGEQVA